LISRGAVHVNPSLLAKEISKTFDYYIESLGVEQDKKMAFMYRIKDVFHYELEF
jgi:hypothetical protein